MSQFNSNAKEFLAQDRIAVAGVSRAKTDAAANGIYRALRESGHHVFAINPKAEEVEGDPCYPNVQSIPGGVDGVVIVTRPELTEQIVADCVQANVPRVWMHNNGFMESSVSQAAVEACRENKIVVIDGGCPMMFLEFGHKCMKVVLGIMGRLPA